MIATFYSRSINSLALFSKKSSWKFHSGALPFQGFLPSTLRIASFAPYFLRWKIIEGNVLKIIENLMLGKLSRHRQFSNIQHFPNYFKMIDDYRTYNIRNNCKHYIAVCFPERIVTISIVWVSWFKHLQAFLNQMLKSQKFFISLSIFDPLLVVKEPFSTATFYFKLSADHLV